MHRVAKQRAFTLMELITVMAVSAILLTIITIPVVQSFNLTRGAQAFADAQDKARLLLNQLVAEIGNSAGVRDNSGRGGEIAIVLPGQDGSPVEILLEHAKLDLLRPSQGDPSNPFFNPDTGRFDPTLRAPKGQMTLPVAPGAALVRYFVGLRRPLSPSGAGTYNNPYDGLLMARNGQADNLYVVWRAEVQPRVYNRQTNRWETDTLLFDPDPDGNPVFDDPYFFTLRPTIDYDPNTKQLTPAGQAKADRIRAWMARSRIMTALSRYDSVQPVVDRATRSVVYDNNVPRVFSLVEFTPTRIVSEPAESMLAVRSGEETPNAEKVGPDVYRTQFGAWTQLFLRLWPSQYPTQPPLSRFEPYTFSSPFPVWQRGTRYLVGRTPAPNQTPLPPGFSIYVYDPAAGNEALTGVEIFDVKSYFDAAALDPLTLNATDPRRYPFSYAVNQALSRNNWFNDPNVRTNFIAYAPMTRSGQVIASFPITQVGGANNPAVPLGQDNLPTAPTGPAFTPNNDPNIGQGNWYDYPTINQRFNKLWNQWSQFNLNWINNANGVRTNLPVERWAKRFIDLRFVPQADGTASPLHPTLGLPRARIVPGSEVVVGPDQNPGPNYGYPVQYTRVTTRPVGPNQYYINYVNQREPDNWNAVARPLPFGIPDEFASNYDTIYDPEQYDPQNLISSVLQAQYRAGYVELNSDFGRPLPDGNITVLYRFQFTEPNDLLGVDYDSRQVMEITLTVRNYAQTTVSQAQTITVKGSATVRNFIR